MQGTNSSAVGSKKKTDIVGRNLEVEGGELGRGPDVDANLIGGGYELLHDAGDEFGGLVQTSVFGRG